MPIEVDFAGPLRVGTPFNLSVAKYGERLRVTLHFDLQVVSTEQARGLMDGFLAELRSADKNP